MKAYPLLLEGISFRAHNIIGIYRIKEKIAVLHCAFSFAGAEQSAEDKRKPNYILLDLFSENFKEHSKTHLCFYEQGFVSALDSELYEEKGKIILNTKAYKGFAPTIAKLIEVSDTSLVEIGQPPMPIARIYNDRKIYPFGNVEVYMHSPFMMACRNSCSGEILWKTKIGAYLYTEVKAESGILYFGTDGKGGKFWAVNLLDGSTVYNYNSRGTSNFLFYRDYVLLSNEKNKPILLHRKDGTLVKALEFGDYKITVYQQMIIVKDRLYAIASKKDTVYAVYTDLV
ncbi:PQQ-binding-like beta-propeller repeat protein [Treponema pedis]|uniref:PQQ repeat-containing protein n=1 Tax=Treponema pedis str. T A4 TaxID=1291379 RepID=S6A1S2_9SPIR|nr:PQQ-binding-like beta-propeller repeat protein [Treponema pedis]AGT44873.1 PQQ repeat-containing protein [Treponema pedis str. T A4]QSI05505.1 hypothetical protein DYQ05_11570 [Treponema pedis]